MIQTKSLSGTFRIILNICAYSLFNNRRTIIFKISIIMLNLIIIMLNLTIFMLNVIIILVKFTNFMLNLTIILVTFTIIYYFIIILALKLLNYLIKRKFAFNFDIYGSFHYWQFFYIKNNYYFLFNYYLLN
jgi:hypothetical protein